MKATEEEVNVTSPPDAVATNNDVTTTMGNGGMATMNDVTTKGDGGIATINDVTTKGNGGSPPRPVKSHPADLSALSQASSPSSSDGRPSSPNSYPPRRPLSPHAIR